MYSRAESAAGEHGRGGEYLCLNEVDERSDTGAMQEVDGVAPVEQIEVVAGRKIPGDVLTGRGTLLKCSPG
jgi:hypothetical protein